MKAQILAALVLVSALGCDVPTEPQAADRVDAKVVNRILIPRGRIVFTKNSSEVWIMDANGNNQRYLTTGYQPVLSPVDDVVAFVRDVGGTAQIFKKNINDHFSGTQLTFGTASSKSYPAWSPDGYQIVYNGYGDSELWVMNSRGASAHMIYDASAAIAEMAAWSPDGTQLAFRDGGGVRVINSDGTGVPFIVTLYHLGVWSHPSWSPDGSRLAMQGRELGGEDIYTIRADGTDLRKITTNPGYDGQPTWGPTGIAYASGNNIWVYSAGAFTELTTDAAPDSGPDWR